MANQLLKDLRSKAAGQKAVIAARHPKTVEPTIQELITGKRNTVEESPVMLENVEVADYGQAFAPVPETAEVTQFLDEAVPQTAQVQEIPLRPEVQASPVQVIEVPQGQVVGQVQGSSDLLDPQSLALP